MNTTQPKNPLPTLRFKAIKAAVVTLLQTMINSVPTGPSLNRSPLYAALALLCFSPLVQGANNFADAQELIGVEADSFVGDISGYFLEGGEPLHRPDNLPSAGHSAWWKWTAPASGFVTINTFRTANTDNPVKRTTVGIYTGNAVNALTPVAKSSYALNPNTGEYIQHPRVTFYATIGQTYHIAVDGTDAGAVGAANCIVVIELRLLVPGSATHLGAINFGATDPAVKGIVKATRNSKGAYSATVTLNGKTYRFSGGMSADGFAQLSVPQAASPTPAPPLLVELDFSGRGEVAVFNSVNEASTFSFLPVAKFNQVVLNTLEGKFTHNLYPSGDADSAGYGTLSISRSGSVRGVMVLPDGVKIPWSSPLCDDTGSFRAFAYKATFGQKGFAVTTFSFAEGGVQDLLTVDGSYFRPAGATNALFYAFGLDIPTLYGEGETYLAPGLGERALGFLDGTNGVGKLRIFSTLAENIPNDVDEPLTIGVTNIVTFTDPVTNRPKLKINPKTGLITGTINLPGAPKRKIQAVLYRNGTPLVAGFATGASQNVGLTILP